MLMGQTSFQPLKGIVSAVVAVTEVDILIIDFHE